MICKGLYYKGGVTHYDTEYTDLWSSKLRHFKHALISINGLQMGVPGKVFNKKILFLFGGGILVRNSYGPGYGVCAGTLILDSSCIFYMNQFLGLKISWIYNASGWCSIYGSDHMFQFGFSLKKQ